VLLLSNQNFSFMYKIEKFDCDAFVVLSNAHHLTHSEFTILNSNALRWAVKRGIKVKRLVKMCTYMTFDPIVPLQVMIYLDQIYRLLFLVKFWKNVFVIYIPWILLLHFCSYIPFEKDLAVICSILNCLYLRMICTKFDWNWRWF
jgi:hypothetical protein